MQTDVLEAVPVWRALAEAASVVVKPLVTALVVAELVGVATPVDVLPVVGPPLASGLTVAAQAGAASMVQPTIPLGEALPIEQLAEAYPMKAAPVMAAPVVAPVIAAPVVAPTLVAPLAALFQLAETLVA